jgi:biopolymer transport protein TolR
VSYRLGKEEVQVAGKISSSDLGDLAEINVTPLVDVMLVLLIIFIITAPMLVQGLKVNLPKQDAPAITGKGVEPLILTLTSDQIVLLGEDPVHPKLLPERLGALLAGRPRPVYLKADENLPYGFVVQILAALDQVGVEQVGMVTQPEDR